MNNSIYISAAWAGAGVFQLAVSYLLSLSMTTPPALLMVSYETIYTNSLARDKCVHVWLFMHYIHHSNMPKEEEWLHCGSSPTQSGSHFA